MKFLPQFRRVRNEVVFYVGLVSTLLAELAVILSDADLESVSGLVAVVPLVAALIGRSFAYGPETVEAMAD